MAKAKKSPKSKDLFGEYTKIHKLKKAADGHKARIKKRGGTVTTQKVAKGYKLTYSFKK